MIYITYRISTLKEQYYTDEFFKKNSYDIYYFRYNSQNLLYSITTYKKTLFYKIMIGF